MMGRQPPQQEHLASMLMQRFERDTSTPFRQVMCTALQQHNQQRQDMVNYIDQMLAQLYPQGDPPGNSLTIQQLDWLYAVFCTGYGLTKYVYDQTDGSYDNAVTAMEGEAAKPMPAAQVMQQRGRPGAGALQQPSALQGVGRRGAASATSPLLFTQQQPVSSRGRKPPVLATEALPEALPITPAPEAVVSLGKKYATPLGMQMIEVVVNGKTGIMATEVNTGELIMKLTSHDPLAALSAHLELAAPASQNRDAELRVEVVAMPKVPTIEDLRTTVGLASEFCDISSATNDLLQKIGERKRTVGVQTVVLTDWVTLLGAEPRMRDMINQLMPCETAHELRTVMHRLIAEYTAARANTAVSALMRLDQHLAEAISLEYQVLTDTPDVGIGSFVNDVMDMWTAMASSANAEIDFEAWDAYWAQYIQNMLALFAVSNEAPPKLPGTLSETGMQMNFPVILQQAVIYAPPIAWSIEPGDERVMVTASGSLGLFEVSKLLTATPGVQTMVTFIEGCKHHHFTITSPKTRLTGSGRDSVFYLRKLDKGSVFFR